MAIEDIMEALKGMGLEKLRAEALADIRSGKKTKRAAGVKRLRAIDGLQRAGVAPEDLVLRKVPVIPAAFRPYSMTGGTFIPGDANELYADLIRASRIHRETAEELGEEGALETAGYVRSAVKAAYGYGESPNPKMKARKVSGFLDKILGSNSKNSWMASKLLAKPQDFVGRGVISPNPDLGMDEMEIPEDMAWTLFDPRLQQTLVAQGIPSSRARALMKARDPKVRKVLEGLMTKYPVMTSRAPAWHKYNSISAYAKISKGDNIMISPFVTAGLGADFDGDTASVHLPMLPEAVKDAQEKLLPSKLLFSIRNRDETLPVPKHEQVLGNASAQLKPSGTVHQFPTRKDALAAYKAGTVKLHDEVEIGDENDAGIPAS